MVFVATNVEAFPQLHEAQAAVTERLARLGLLEELENAIQTPPFLIKSE